METYESVPQIRCSGNLPRTETIVTVKFRGLIPSRVSWSFMRQKVGVLKKNFT